MASLCRNLAALLFFVSPLMHSHLFTHAASTSPPVTHPRIIYMTDSGLEDQYDYDYGYDDSTKPPPPKVLSSTKIPYLYQEPQLCQYNPCMEDQEPCSNLSAQTGCLCPGLSGANVRPHPPRIQALVPVSEGTDRGKIEVQWCAPSSVVSQYRIVIEGRWDDSLKFGDASRQGLVRSLEVGTKVCVVAVNNAGSSEPSEFSCKRYESRDSSDHNLLAWVIGGGVALLLLITIAALILRKYQKFRKGKRYSTGGILKVQGEHCDPEKCNKDNGPAVV